MNQQSRNKVPGRNGGTLCPCKPGVSGNPAGRPPTRHIREMLEELGAEIVEAKRGGQSVKGTRMELLLQTAWAKAISGDVHWAKEIFARLWGKVPDQVDVTTGGKSLAGADGLAAFRRLSAATQATVLKELGHDTLEDQ